MGSRIRREEPRDRDAIRAVHDAAFGQPDEGRIVDRLRASGRLTLSLLEEGGGTIRGHVAFSPVRVSGPEGEWEAQGLGPIGVLPGHQKTGIGSGLMRRSLDLVRAAGHGVVVVLGDPAYYSRFGFVVAADHGLDLPFEVPSGAFQVRELTDGALGGRKGTVHYRPEFFETA